MKQLQEENNSIKFGLKIFYIAIGILFGFAFFICYLPMAIFCLSLYGVLQWSLSLISVSIGCGILGGIFKYINIV